MRRALVAAIVLVTACAAQAANTDKTLVSWVSLTDRNQRAGSVLTIQRGPIFDGIVFAERVPNRWMAGSNYFHRTQKVQNKNPAETTDGKALLQMAIVYKGDTITIYRNGKLYASYKAKNVDLLSGKNNFVLFGLRCVGGRTSIGGSIEDARIYSRALTVDELKALEPNKKSAIEPYAWWNFEGDKVRDLTGRFPEVRLQGGAKLANGRLILGGNAALVAGKPYVPVTPSWPKKPPANWPTYHLAHPGPGNAWPGDPNPAFFYKGRYHLHYIYNYGGCSFGHVSSTDMVHWKWHPTMLTPKTTGHGMFSGTGFFTKEGKPAMIYHGQGSGRNWIAYGVDDNLDKWTQPEAVIAKTANGQNAPIRYWDPDCWLNGDTYYALSGGGNPPLMKSSDLKNWKSLGPLLHDDYPRNIGVAKGEDISCGNMFKIGNKWMLLCISHRLGCRYYLGDFKDEKYLPEFHAMMSWNGNNYFAPESMLTKDGRRVMWAWPIGLPIAPSGVQALPRESELPADSVLRIRPLRELKTLRYDEKTKEDIAVAGGTAENLDGFSGDALELEIQFTSPAAKQFGLDVLCDKTGKNGIRITVIPEKKTLRVGRVNAPFTLKKDEDLTLRIFVDKTLVEVFANDRQAALTVRRYNAANIYTRLFADGGDVKVKKATAWKMKSIYEGDTVFRKD